MATRRRAAVVASKRSRLYSRAAVRPPPTSAKTRVRSNLAVPASTSRPLTCNPGSSSSRRGVFCTISITWKSGVCEVSRRGCSSSTSFSNGRSWWA